MIYPCLLQALMHSIPVSFLALCRAPHIPTGLLCFPCPAFSELTICSRTLQIRRSRRHSEMASHSSPHIQLCPSLLLQLLPRLLNPRIRRGAPVPNTAALPIPRPPIHTSVPPLIPIRTNPLSLHDSGRPIRPHVQRIFLAFQEL